MNILISQKTDPYFNLATEEYLFNHFTDDFCFLYRNSPSVICGKHQIPFKEINTRYVTSNNIAVCRRYSGGGTVYNDGGNVNFCFIFSKQHTQENAINFEKYLYPIVLFLTQLGLKVETNARNNILIEQKKISGNAQHISKNRTLHHGTLLFDTCLYDLKHAVLIQEKYIDKSVLSVPSSVTNITDYLPYQFSVFEFIQRCMDFLQKFYSAKEFHLTNLQEMEIVQLAKTKYMTDEWIYKYSPSYIIKNNLKVLNNSVFFTLTITDGKIEKVDFTQTSIEFVDLTEIFNNLAGTPHDVNSVKIIVNSFISQKQSIKELQNEIIFSFF